jgi:hypothetical protein
MENNTTLSKQSKYRIKQIVDTNKTDIPNIYIYRIVHFLVLVHDTIPRIKPTLIDELETKDFDILPLITLSFIVGTA